MAAGTRWRELEEAPSWEEKKKGGGREIDRLWAGAASRRLSGCFLIIAVPTGDCQTTYNHTNT